MNFTDLTALSFDCYGTLIDWETGILNALEPFLRGRRPAMSDNEILQAYGEEETRVEAENPSMPYTQILQTVYRGLMQRWNLPATAEGEVSFGHSVKNWPAFEDSAQALGYLKNHFTLVILSNVDHASFRHSQRKLGVDFDHVFTAEDIGFYKPDQRNFQFMLRALGEAGIGKRHLLHVAQSLYHDTVPAKALGLRTLWVNRRHGREGWGATPAPVSGIRPDNTVTSMAELAQNHRDFLAQVG